MSNYDTHRREVEETYAGDPFVTNAWYGRMLEEADDLDVRDAEQAEVEEYWEARASEEETDLA